MFSSATEPELIHKSEMRPEIRTPKILIDRQAKILSRDMESNLCCDLRVVCPKVNPSLLLLIEYTMMVVNN